MANTFYYKFIFFETPFDLDTSSFGIIIKFDKRKCLVDR